MFLNLLGSYLVACRPQYQPKYNDIPLVIDPEVAAVLQTGGMDPALARHFAHLFIRDPLVLYREILELPDEGSADHFENLQSTNWQTMRFKPPPPGSSIGWRVEFRSMEVQVTDFENAAYTLFVVLLSRAILSFNLNLYIPLSRVDENMAVRFDFRVGVYRLRPIDGGEGGASADGPAARRRA